MCNSVKIRVVVFLLPESETWTSERIVGGIDGNVGAEKQ